jgi:hypothetical protein
MAALLHSLHWCHGHSHFPNADEREEESTLLAPVLITQTRPKAPLLLWLETNSTSKF